MAQTEQAERAKARVLTKLAKGPLTADEFTMPERRQLRVLEGEDKIGYDGEKWHVRSTAPGDAGPSKMHGFLVLHSRVFGKQPATRAGRVILVDRGPGYHPGGRYVVACHYRNADGVWDEEWDNGNYCETASEADDAFTVLVARRCGGR